MITNDPQIEAQRGTKNYCKKCDYTCSHNGTFARHLLTSKHKMITIEAQRGTKNVCKTESQELNYCDLCKYKCNRKDNFDRHLVSLRHQQLCSNNLNSVLIYQCLCGNKYTHRQGLHKHKKQCTFNTPLKTSSNTDIAELKTLVLDIVKANIQSQSITTNQTIINNNNNNNNNTVNKTFNLNFFLNETCKDAMNIMDFVDSLQIQLSDLESIGELGFVNGLSKLIIKGLNELEENERPVHCSDLKRETMYIKDENKWEKEDSENTKMKKALRYIARKNTKMIPAWKEKHPDCRFSASHLSDQYNHIILEAMGGSGDNDDEKADKIIKKIAKEVLISKN